MTPKLGEKVYVIYGNSISLEKVGYIGKDSFIIEAFESGVHFDFLEWNFADFEKNWFVSLTKAKEALLLEAKTLCRKNEKAKIVKLDKDYWEVEYY